MINLQTLSRKYYDIWILVKTISIKFWHLLKKCKFYPNVWYFLDSLRCGQTVASWGQLWIYFNIFITKHIWLRDSSAWFYWKLIFYKVCGILWELCSSIQWTGIIYLHNSVNISIIWPHSQKLKELSFIQHTSTLSNLYKKFIQYLIIWFNSFRRRIIFNK